MTIPDEVLKTDPYYANVNDWQFQNILPGEQWNGFFGGNGAAEGSYVMTRPMLEWMKEKQYGPLLALLFKVDVSRCTSQQKQKISELLK